MSDLISRQDAIDAIKALWDGAPTAQHVSAMFDCEDAIQALPSAQPEHVRWIPCNERLPEIGDTYIVTGIQKDPHEKDWHYFVDVASSHGDYIDDYWDTFNDWVEGQETHIIAWMPLPKPCMMDEVSHETD